MQGSAYAAAKTVIVKLYDGAKVPIVVPSVGVEQLALEVFVSGAMETVSATLALQHHLPASGREEVRGLIVRGNFEFLNAFKGRRDGTSAPYAVVSIVVVALKVARDITAVQHVRILVAQRAGDLAAVDVTAAGRIRSGCGLQGQ